MNGLKITIKQTIDAPAEKVWDTLRSFENPERFVPIVKSSTIQRAENSTQRSCTVQLGDQEGQLVERLDLIDDEHKALEFTMVEAPPPFNGIKTRWEIVTLSDDASEVNIDVNIETENSEIIKTTEGIFQMAADGLKRLHESTL